MTRACIKMGCAVVPHLRRGDANVCVALLPWWNIGAEARKRNESCVVIHSAPTQERDASKNVHTTPVTIKSNTPPPARELTVYVHTC